MEKLKQKKIMQNKRALIFTIDGIIALILTALIIVSTLFFIQDTNPQFNNINLQRVSMDSLSILEKDNTLKNAVLSNSNSTINLFLNSLPTPYCGSISILNSSLNTLISSTKNNCTVSDEKVIIRRIFTTPNIHIAQMVMWYE